jgi:RHS repeat-associated protein
MSDGSGSESYTYDIVGRVTALTKVISGSTYTIGYAYNAGSEPTSISYPASTTTVQSGYNAIGQLCGVGVTVSGCSVTTPYASSFSYNAPGQLTGFTYGNGVTASMGYSVNRLQMTSLAYAKGSTNLLNLNYLYSYDATNCSSGVTGNNGQIQCIKDVTSTAAAGRSAAYTYDELGRLSSALTTGSTGTGGYAQWGLSFSYDRYGNMIKEQSTAGSVGTTCLAVSTSTNQVTGTCALPSLSTYSYDANGNMLGDGVNSSMTYDAANHLISLYNSSSGGAAYVYDGNGNRVKKCVPNCSSPTSATVYIFSGSKVIAEYPAGSTGTSFSAEYLYAGGLKVATVTSSAQTYHLRDHLSVRVNTNSSGALIGEQGHYPFGDNWYLTSTTTKEQFTTYERDAESGNDFAMARYNVNRLGRFSSVDPLSGNIKNPQSLNHYAYVTNDPINASDPTGMAGGDLYEQSYDACGDAAFTTGTACVGQGDPLSGEGGYAGWFPGFWAQLGQGDPTGAFLGGQYGGPNIQPWEQSSGTVGYIPPFFDFIGANLSANYTNGPCGAPLCEYTYTYGLDNQPLSDPFVECISNFCSSYSITGVPYLNPWAGSGSYAGGGQSATHIYNNQPVNYMHALAQAGRISAPVASPYFVPSVLGSAAGIAGLGLAAPAIYAAADYGMLVVGAGIETYIPGGIAAASQVPAFASGIRTGANGGFLSSAPMSPGGMLGWAVGYTYYNGTH